MRNYGLRAWKSVFDTAQITLINKFSMLLYTSQKINLTGYQKITIVGKNLQGISSCTLYISDTLHDFQNDDSLNLDTTDYKKLVKYVGISQSTTITVDFSSNVTKYIAIYCDSPDSEYACITRISIS